MINDIDIQYKNNVIETHELLRAFYYIDGSIVSFLNTLPDVSTLSSTLTAIENLDASQENVLFEGGGVY